MKQTLSPLISRLKNWEAQLWPEHTYVLTDAMKQSLKLQPFQVADVGAAYGIDSRWQLVEQYTRFITFEPDVRSQDYDTTEKTVNFATGLSDHSGEQSLYLTHLPAASSLYPHNLEALASYANYEWHQHVGQALIQLDTLDHCLEAQGDLKPDFIKIDVEGADLDVLKGGLDTLTGSILGVQIEVSFIERHKGAPFFAEVDTFLRDRGFALFSLAREHWLRQNQLCGVNSRPQLIWADAVYVLDKAHFLARIRGTYPESQFSLLVKFVVILLGYGLHDYAIEIITAVQDQKMISEESAEDLQQAVYTSVVPAITYCLSCLSGIGITSLVYLLSLPVSPLRKRVSGYVRKHWSNLLHWGARSLSRGGLYDSSFSDTL